MIEIYEFMALELNERANYLWEFGVYIMAREEGEFKINLYRVNTYYVEVFYSAKDNEIVIIKPFKSINALSPYLNLIDLNTL
jgi:hypothetical protein